MAKWFIDIFIFIFILLVEAREGTLLYLTLTVHYVSQQQSLSDQLFQRRRSAYCINTPSQFIISDSTSSGTMSCSESRITLLNNQFTATAQNEIFNFVIVYYGCLLKCKPAIAMPRLMAWGITSRIWWFSNNLVRVTYATPVYTGEWLGCERARAENLDWSQRSHPLVPVIRGLHLHERPIEMSIAMEIPIGLRVITTGRIGRTRLKRVSMESWLVQRPVCVWKCD